MDKKRKPLSQLELGSQQSGKVKRQKQIEISENTSQHAGTIIKMTLRNFMCHSLLEVNFKDTNINYIVGRNGSGKSAILTALVVGLGAKANVTNRGNSIKNFIKAGTNSSTIEITLYNGGIMAYKPNVYGDKIIVQRYFTSSGSSSYKIKNSTGKTVSTVTKEIQQITTYLNIQVNNPICILNQDTSRNFLSTSDPKQKFLLFMRATGLETLAEEYQKITQNKRQCIRLLKEKDAMLKELESELQELKAKYENLKSILNLKDQLADLELQLLWAKARDSENEHNEQVRIYQELQEKYNEHQERMKGKGKNLEEIIAKVTELNQQIAELRNESEVQSRPLVELRNRINELREVISEKKREKHIVMKAIESKNRECVSLQEEIKNFTDNLSQLEQEKMKRLNDIQDIEEKLKGFNALIETSQNDQFQMRHSIKRMQEEEATLRAELDQLGREYSKIEDHLHTLQSETDNNLLLYGREMPAIINAINTMKNQFSQMPRGPLGSYIKIKDKKWAVAVEGFLSANLLRAFAVDNSKDAKLLMKIFEKCCTGGRKPTIFTSKFFHKPHDVSRNKVRPFEDCISIYDILEINDPVAINCLIDQTHMEKILLIPTGKKARDLLSSASTVPKNCRQGVTMQGDRYYPDPNYKTYSSNYHQARYLQVNAADVIEDLQRKIQQLNAKRESIKNQHRTMQKDINDQNNRLVEISRKVDKLNRGKVALRQKCEEMKSTVDPEMGSVQNLEAELTEIKSGLNKKEIVVKKIDEDMKESKSKITEHEEQLKKMSHISKGFEQRIVSLEKQIMELASKKKELSINENFAKTRLSELKAQVNESDRERKNKEKIMEMLKNEASSVGPRMDQINSVTRLAKEITVMQRNIKKIEVNTEKPEEIMQKYQVRKEKHNSAVEMMKVLEEDLRELQTGADKRKRYYKLTEDYFITYIQHSFSNILEFRQFQGSLEIDLENKSLELVVIPQQGSQGLVTTANLSGGERSFSTVAFLYSLWQCMDFPFYFLDEFDVYMDKVNRTKVMEILIHHAKTRPDLQFVFLTPQDVSFINDPSVAIHRLENPKRRRVDTD